MKAQGREVGLSLGSNLGDRRRQLSRALRRLDGEILAGMEVSSLWESEPVEVVQEQPPFLNACAVGSCALSPLELLHRCQELEQEAGRKEASHGQPRVLDLDLLYHGEESRAGAELSLPHPALARRRFVLAPLAELRPQWRHPLNRRSVGELLAGLGEEQSAHVIEADDEWWRVE